METVGLGFYWNDMVEGRQFRTINRTITEADLVGFINTTGMVEMMFTDATYNAAHGAIQGRVVPGMLAYTIVEGLLVQATMQHTGLALLETAIKVHGPTLVGDTIHGEVEITGARATSKGNRGIVSSTNKVVNQDGKNVLTYTAVRMMAGRPE